MFPRSPSMAFLTTSMPPHPRPETPVTSSEVEKPGAKIRSRVFLFGQIRFRTDQASFFRLGPNTGRCLCRIRHPVRRSIHWPRNEQRTGLWFPGGACPPLPMTSGGSIAVIQAVADDVDQGVVQAFDNGFVQFGLVAFGEQFGFLAQIVGKDPGPGV